MNLLELIFCREERNMLWVVKKNTRDVSPGGPQAKADVRYAHPEACNHGFSTHIVLPAR